MSSENPPLDHASAGEHKSSSPIEKNLKSGVTWKRGLFMLVSSILVSMACFANSILVVLGFCWVLFTGEVNPQIKSAGQSIAAYIYGAWRYLTFNSDDRPFALGGEWPSAQSDD